jgi:outer membrane lipoprotein-sorting protein
MSGCAVRRVSQLPPSQLPAPALTASEADLAKDVNEWSAKISTLTAIVQFQPSASFQHASIMKEYRDIRGYILLKKPSLIRVQGQAPVVGTEIFDMVSDGRQFRLSIPPKNQFIIGENSYRGPQKEGLENLRPQHILGALLIAPIDAATKYFVEEDEQAGHSYYVLTLVKPGKDAELKLDRKIWFERSDLRVARTELFGASGRLEESVRYSQYSDFQGISYPSHIELSRPADGYTLGIQFQKATFNEEIPQEKFNLPAPPNAKVIQLGEGKVQEAPSGR